MLGKINNAVLIIYKKPILGIVMIDIDARETGRIDSGTRDFLFTSRESIQTRSSK